MKKLNAFLFVPLLAIVVTACDKPGTEDRHTGTNIPVEIPVAPLGEYDVVSSRAGKGPMNGWQNTEVYMVYGESADGTFQGFSEAKKGIVVTGRTSFQPQLFYPVTNTIFLRGVHPREQVTNLDPDLGITGDKILYTITGQEDIMISNVVSGSVANTLKDQDERLHYNHLLTQLSFTMKGDEGFPSTLRVRYIRVKGVSVNAILDLNPDLDFNDPGILVFTDPPASDLTAYENQQGLIISDKASREAGYVMFRPGENFNIEIEFTNGEKVLVTNIATVNGGLDISAGNTEMGKHYMVELTFRCVGLLPSVTAEWKKENIGNENGWW